MCPGPRGFRPSTPGHSGGLTPMTRMSGLCSFSRRPDAADGPPGPYARHKVGDVRRLTQNLLAGGVVVGLGIELVGVLIAPEIAVRVPFVPTLDLTKGFVVPQHRVGKDNLRAVSQQPLLPLQAGVLRHDQRHPVAQHGAQSWRRRCPRCRMWRPKWSSPSSAVRPG